MPYSTELRNAKLAANNSVIGNAGKLDLLTSANAVLASFTLGSPFAPAPVNGVQSPTLPAAATGIANGTVAKARVTKADGTLVMDVTVGAAGSGAMIIINTTTISTGASVSVLSWTITGGDA